MAPLGFNEIALAICLLGMVLSLPLSIVSKRSGWRVFVVSGYGVLLVALAVIVQMVADIG